MRASTRTRRRGTGQSLAEFALVFPVVILILFGAIDLGRAVYAYNTVANAAREGARVAIVNQIFVSPDSATRTDCSEQHPIEDPAHPQWTIRACAINAGTSLGIQTSGVHISYTVPSGTTLTCASSTDATPASGAINLGCVANVTVDYTFTPLTPIIGSLFSAIHMSSTAQMPVERLFP